MERIFLALGMQGIRRGRGAGRGAGRGTVSPSVWDREGDPCRESGGAKAGGRGPKG